MDVRVNHHVNAWKKTVDFIPALKKIAAFQLSLMQFTKCSMEDDLWRTEH